jgi:hypothetical protein
MCHIQTADMSFSLRSRVRLIFGSTHSGCRSVTFAHVRTVFGVSVISGSCEVIDIGSQGDPHHGVGGTAGLSLRFG